MVGGKVSLFIGRFQPLHNGHLFALKYIAKRSKKVFVVIGSSQEKKTEKNPFSARERMAMMKAVFVKEKLAGKCKVFLLSDIPNDFEWVSYLDAHVPRYDVCYSNNALVLKLMRRSGKKVERVPLLARAKYRGALVRERMRAGKEVGSRVPRMVHERIGAGKNRKKSR
jgi:nicotinamide-nucleotide adenylyltransferase